MYRNGSENFQSEQLEYTGSTLFIPASEYRDAESVTAGEKLPQPVLKLSPGTSVCIELEEADPFLDVCGDSASKIHEGSLEGESHQALLFVATVVNPFEEAILGGVGIPAALKRAYVNQIMHKLVDSDINPLPVTAYSDKPAVRSSYGLLIRRDEMEQGSVAFIASATHPFQDKIKFGVFLDTCNCFVEIPFAVFCLRILRDIGKLAKIVEGRCVSWNSFRSSFSENRVTQFQKKDIQGTKSTFP